MPPQEQQGMPPQNQGLPPELQQILNSLPDNVKQYIMSLPIEQQVQELTRIAQSQMQAAQNSPNQMMQQQMNQQPQQGMPPQMKYGGRYQNGGNPRNYALDKPIGNTIPNYPYNTIETPNESKPEVKYQFKEGDNINLNGKNKTIVKTVINGKEFLGYIGDDGAFRPLNIGTTTRGTTAPQGGVNTGAYDFNPPKPTVTVVPPKGNNPTFKPPVKKIQLPTSGGGNRPSIPGPRYIDPNPEEGYPAGKKPVPQPIDRGPYHPYPGIRVSPNTDKPQGFKPNGGVFTKPDTGSGVNYMDPRDLVKNAGLPAKLNTNRVLYNEILKKQSQLDDYTEQFDNAYREAGNNASRNEYLRVLDNKREKAKLELENLIRQYSSGKRQYGGRLYALGGPQYVDPDGLPYGDYRRENRRAARDVKQSMRNQKRLTKLQNKEQRLRLDSPRYRMNQKRQAQTLGRYNVNTHGADNHAANRDYFEDQIEQKSGLSMPNAQAPQRISPNRQPISPNVNPNPTPPNKPTTNVIPVKPSTGGSKKGLSDFEKAFAAARKAQGPGGRFWWNGREFTTDYKEEVGKGKSGNNNPPSNPPTAGPTEPTSPQSPATPSEQPSKDNSWLRQEVGELGRGVMKVASYLDPGDWASWGLKKAGMSDKWADRIGTGVSIGSMFIPGLGIASGIGKAGKVVKGIKTLDRAVDAAKAAKTAAKAGRATEEGLAIYNNAKNALKSARVARAAAIKKGATYGPYMGETASKAGAFVKNNLKRGVNIAPSVNMAGSAGDEYSKGNDTGAALRLAGAIGMGAVGGIKTRGVNKTSTMRNEMSDFAKIKGKDRYLKDGIWRKVGTKRPAINEMESYRGLEKVGAGKVMGSRSPILREYDNAGNMVDDMGNIYNKAGNLIGKTKTNVTKALDRGIETVNSGLSTAKNTGTKIVDKAKDALGKSGAKVGESVDDAMTLIAKKDADFTKHLSDMDYVFSPDGKIRRGGFVVEGKTLNRILDEFRAAMAKKQYGGQIYKTGGKMRIITCKYGC